MAEINFDTSIYDEERKQEQLRQQMVQESQQEEETEQPAQGQATPQQSTQEAKPEKKAEEQTEGGDLGMFAAEKALDFVTTGGQDTKKRVAQGTMDTFFDMTSKFLPFMQQPADWWDEVSGRKTETDPYKKMERDMNAIVVPSLLAGGAIGAIGLTGKAAFGANLGAEALISGTSDTTSDPGNLGNLLEGFAPDGVKIPWASRDTDSPDTIYWKNFTENMLLAGVAGLGGALPTSLTFKNKGNVVVPKNDIAQSILDATPEKPPTLQEAILRNQKKKREAQLGEGMKALADDPDGVKGYNAFVNEPAEDVARVTMDETGNTVEFMSDNARIQNNVDTTHGRTRPILDNDAQEALARADAPARNKILKKVEDELGAKFELNAGGKKLTAKQVSEAVDALYDATISPVGKNFEDAVKGFQDLNLRVGPFDDAVASKGSRKIIDKTINRLVDALSPYKQRASAAIQTQTAASASDLARGVDLMEPIVDTSRLQELMMPRLRVLLKEQATAKIAENTAEMLKGRLTKQVSTIEGLVDVDDKFYNEMFDAYTEAVEQQSKKIDEFVEELSGMAKENPSYLRPVYRMFAKTDGEVDSMHKLNQYLSNRLGLIRKSIVDGKPEVPSLILKELQATRTANMINGTAPAKAWVGNLAAIAIRPMTQLAGSVPIGLATGNWKQLQRSLTAFGQIQETLRRASKMARDEWRFVNSNPDAAMARGRKDYDFSDANTGWKQTLADYEEMEELSETMRPGRKALWDLTKGTHSWNRKNFNRWGVNAMYSADGFVKSMMASMDSRFKAYDKAVSETNGVLNKSDFVKLEKQFYDEAFDSEGLLKDGYAKFASEEIALNADNKLIGQMEHLMDTFPIMKSIFMFPRTKANAISVLQTFDPTGATAMWRDKSWKTITANAGDPQAVKEILEMHGMKGGSVDDFLMLKSEYIGRKLTTGGLVTTGAMATVAGNMTGSGAYMSPAEKQRAIREGWAPYTLYGKSYENAPDWMRLSLSLTSDITMAHFGPNPKGADDWFGAMGDVLSANVSSEMFGSEVESLSELMNMGPRAIDRYMAGLVDTMLHGSGVRSALNDVLVPQLMDVENNFFSYLANRNRWITHPLLTEAVDPFTGEQINGAKYPLEKFIGRFMPFWETAGGQEPWRKWMLSTGWTGLSKPETNPYTGEEVTPEERKFIHEWIGENGKWAKEIESMMDWDDGKFEREWRKLPGNKKAQLDIGETFTHKMLDESKRRQFNAAWDAYVMQYPEAKTIKTLNQAKDAYTYDGDYDAAADTQDQINDLLNTYR